MKSAGFYLIYTFVFFLLGQFIWTIAMINHEPLFGSKLVEELLIGHSFSISGIFGLISGFKLYNLRP